MNDSHSPATRLWRQFRAHPRLLVASLAGAFTFIALPSTSTTPRVLLTWDVGAGLYLLLALVMIAQAPVEHMKWRARMQDDGAAAVLFLTVAAAVASLAAIVLELSGLKALPLAEQARIAAILDRFEVLCNDLTHGLPAEIAAGRFREDLYYRISEITIRIPPLRERGGGCRILLARTLLERFAAQHRRQFRGFSPDAQNAIENYAWPGNVREMENKLKAAVK